jgi:6-methylsalicylate decarboxylase
MVNVNGWIDVHAHFSPPTTPAIRHAQWEGARALCFMAPQPYHWTPESTLEYMDRHGIAMHMLSNIPKDPTALRESNDYGAQLVAEHPTRFGLLAALPTDDPDACLAEIERGGCDTHPDGYAVATRRGDVYLGDERLEPVWAELDRRRAVVFVHPATDALPQSGLPTPLVEVAFETARTVVGMLYAGVFRRYPNVTIILAHGGGALPALSGRLGLLGTAAWVPNPHRISHEEITEQLGRLYLDTAASGTDANLAAALTMVSRDHLVYGADSGVPCSNEASLDANLQCLLNSSVVTHEEADRLGHRALTLFPSAARRRQDSFADAARP